MVRGLVALADLERHARLDGGDEAHDPLADPVSLSDLLGQLVFVLSPVAGLDVVEGDDRTTSVGHQLAGVGGDALGGFLGIGGEVLEGDALGPQEAPGTVLLVELGEMALEDHPVEHGQAAGDPLAVKILERSHDNLLEQRSSKCAPQAGSSPGDQCRSLISDVSAQGRRCRPVSRRSSAPAAINPQPEAAPQQTRAS